MNDLQLEIADLCESDIGGLRASLRRRILSSGAMVPRKRAWGEAKPVRTEWISREDQRAAIREHRFSLRRELSETDAEGVGSALGWLWFLASVQPERFNDVDHAVRIAAKRCLRAFPDDAPVATPHDDAAAAFFARLKGAKPAWSWDAADKSAESESRTHADVAKSDDLDWLVCKLLGLAMDVRPIPAVNVVSESAVQTERPAGKAGAFCWFGTGYSASAPERKPNGRVDWVLRRCGVQFGRIDASNWCPSDRKVVATPASAVECKAVRRQPEWLTLYSAAGRVRYYSVRLQARVLSPGFEY